MFARHVPLHGFVGAGRKGFSCREMFVNADFKDENIIFIISSCRMMNNVCPACTPGFVGAEGRKIFLAGN